MQHLTNILNCVTLRMISQNHTKEGFGDNNNKMIVSSKLQHIFLLSIPVFITHGIEEYITKFYNIDNFSRFVFSYTETMSSLQASFITFQIMVWILLVSCVYF